MSQAFQSIFCQSLCFLLHCRMCFTMLDFNPNGVLLMAEKSMSPASFQGRMTYRATLFCRYFPSVTTNKFESRWGNSHCEYDLLRFFAQPLGNIPS